MPERALAATVRKRHGQMGLPLHLVLIVALFGAAVWGNLWLAFVVAGLALVNDILLTRERSESELLLDRLGAGPWIRALVRSFLLAVALGVATDGPDLLLVLYAVIGMLVHGCGLLVRALMSLVLMRAPEVGVRNIGQTLGYGREIDLASRVQDSGTYLLLAVEYAVFLGLTLVHAQSGSDGVAVAIAVAGALLILSATGLAVWRSWRALTRGAAQYTKALFAELAEYSPEAIVYMSAGKAQSGYILNQWLPVLDAMNKRALVVVREASNVGPIAKTSLPVVFAPQTRHVEELVLPSVRLAFYLANAGKNVHLQREPALKHIFLNHGDSDKSTSANPVSRVYDEVWVAGEAAVDRYHAAGVDIPRERFAIVGRPQVDGLIVGPLATEATTHVLYAPTWEGYYQEANYSSLEVMGVSLIKSILANHPDVGIIFKPHPSSGVQRAGMRAARSEVERLLRQSPNASRHVIAGDHPGMTLNDCFDRSDVLVSDISSVVTDFLHTERPIVISNPTSMPHERFRTTFPTQAASYIADRDLQSFSALLADALGDDSLLEPRRAMKVYVLGDLPAGPVQEFSDQADRVYDEAAASALRVQNAFTITHPTHI